MSLHNSFFIKSPSGIKYIIIDGELKFQKPGTSSWTKVLYVNERVANIEFSNDKVYAVGLRRVYTISDSNPNIAEEFYKVSDLETLETSIIEGDRIFIVSNQKLRVYDTTNRKWEVLLALDANASLFLIKALTKTSWYNEYYTDKVPIPSTNSILTTTDEKREIINERFNDSRIIVEDIDNKDDVIHDKTMSFFNILGERAESPQLIMDQNLEIPLKNKIHDMKVDNSNLDITDNKIHTDKDKQIEMTALDYDASKNYRTFSRIIYGCQLDEEIPLFKIRGKEMNARSESFKNSDLKAFLIEMKISAPRMNFKGIVTSGLEEDGKYGVGFISEYCYNEYPKLFLKASRDKDDEDLIIISMINYASNSYDDISDEVEDIYKKKYAEMFPVDIHLSSLICDEIIEIEDVNAVISNNENNTSKYISIVTNLPDDVLKRLSTSGVVGSKFKDFILTTHNYDGVSFRNDLNNPESLLTFYNKEEWLTKCNRADLNTEDNILIGSELVYHEQSETIYGLGICGNKDTTLSSLRVMDMKTIFTLNKIGDVNKISVDHTMKIKGDIIFYHPAPGEPLYKYDVNGNSGPVAIVDSIYKLYEINDTGSMIIYKSYKGDDIRISFDGGLSSNRYISLIDLTEKSDVYDTEDSIEFVIRDNKVYTNTKDNKLVRLNITPGNEFDNPEMVDKLQLTESNIGVNPIDPVIRTKYGATDSITLGPQTTVILDPIFNIPTVSCKDEVDSTVIDAHSCGKFIESILGKIRLLKDKDQFILQSKSNSGSLEYKSNGTFVLINAVVNSSSNHRYTFNIPTSLNLFDDKYHYLYVSFKEDNCKLWVDGKVIPEDRNLRTNLSELVTNSLFELVSIGGTDMYIADFQVFKDTLSENDINELTMNYDNFSLETIIEKIPGCISGLREIVNNEKGFYILPKDSDNVYAYDLIEGDFDVIKSEVEQERIVYNKDEKVLVHSGGNLESLINNDDLLLSKDPTLYSKGIIDLDNHVDLETMTDEAYDKVDFYPVYASADYVRTIGTLAPNGKIYTFPSLSDFVEIFDPETNTISTIVVAALSSAIYNYHGQILAPNGKLYGVPSYVNIMTVVDTTDDSHYTIDLDAVEASETLKYKTGVVVGNTVYMIPYNSDRVMIINSLTDEITYITLSFISTRSAKFYKAVVGKNGKIYCIPFNSTTILKIDTNNNNAIQYQGSFDSTHILYGTGELMPNGKIYCAPYGAQDTLVIDTITDTYHTIEPIVSTDNLYEASVIVGNKIYFLPFEGTNIMVLNSVDESVIYFGTIPTDVGYRSGILMKNDKIYAFPWVSLTLNQLMVIDTRTNTIQQVDIPEESISRSENIIKIGDSAYIIPYEGPSMFKITVPTILSELGISGWNSIYPYKNASDVFVLENVSPADFVYRSIEDTLKTHLLVFYAKVSTGFYTTPGLSKFILQPESNPDMFQKYMVLFTPTEGVSPFNDLRLIGGSTGFQAIIVDPQIYLLDDNILTHSINSTISYVNELNDKLGRQGNSISYGYLNQEVHGPLNVTLNNRLEIVKHNKCNFYKDNKIASTTGKVYGKCLIDHVTIAAKGFKSLTPSGEAGSALIRKGVANGVDITDKEKWSTFCLNVLSKEVLQLKSGMSYKVFGSIVINGIMVYVNSLTFYNESCVSILTLDPNQIIPESFRTIVKGKYSSVIDISNDLVSETYEEDDSNSNPIIPGIVFEDPIDGVLSLAIGSVGSGYKTGITATPIVFGNINRDLVIKDDSKGVSIALIDLVILREDGNEVTVSVGKDVTLVNRSTIDLTEYAYPGIGTAGNIHVGKIL